MPKNNSKQLTVKQSQILEWVISESVRVQRFQTIREVAEHFGITPKGATDHLNLIRKKGHIVNSNNRAGIYPVALKIVRVD